MPLTLPSHALGLLGGGHREWDLSGVGVVLQGSAGILAPNTRSANSSLCNLSKTFDHLQVCLSSGREVGSGHPKN